MAEIEQDLKIARINAKVTGRPKHYYSIYQKMIVGGRDFSDIYDLVGIRILVDEDRDCYSALGVIHSRWNPVLGRFKDYVAMPKFNMYQSLHTTVIGPQGKPVEVQIRTRPAPPRRVRRRRTLEVQGEHQGRRRHRPPRRQGRPHLAAPAARLAERGRGPGEFLESLRFEMNHSRSTSSPRAAT